MKPLDVELIQRIRAANATHASTAQRSKFWTVTAGKIVPDDEPCDEVMIYGEIGFSFFDPDSVGAAAFARDLVALKAGKLTVRVNSPGGDVFDGIAIRNMLVEHSADVTVRVDALAASIASVIATAGNKVIMEPNSMMMIHDASGGAWGNCEDMLAVAELLDQISDNIAEVYAARAGGDAAMWRNVMKGERWYSAQEAVDVGLADEVAAGLPVRQTQAAQVQGALILAAGWNERYYGNESAAQRFAALVPVAEVNPRPAVDLKSFRECFTAPTPPRARLASVMPTDLGYSLRAAIGQVANSQNEPAPPPRSVVKLPDLPEPKVTPAPVSNPLRDAITSAYSYVATHRPEHEAKAPAPAALPDLPPVHVNLAAVRRAMTLESRTTTDA